MFDYKQRIKDEWRELGFYYDNGETIENQEWRFFGSKKGLEKFSVILDDYLSNPHHIGFSQETAYGPYTYLKIITWDEPTITVDYFAGTLEDIKNLKNIIADKLSKTEVGQSFSIENDYGVDNTVTATFYVMPDNFDPVSMDKNYS